MKPLLNSVRQSGFNGARNRRKEGNFLLHVFRQSADDENACYKENRAYEEQKLRPATDRNEIECRVCAAEDQHLSEIFQNEEGDKRHHSHCNEWHNVARSRYSPVGSS